MVRTDAHHTCRSLWTNIIIVMFRGIPCYVDIHVLHYHIDQMSISGIVFKQSPVAQIFWDFFMIRMKIATLVGTYLVVCTIHCLSLRNSSLNITLNSQGGFICPFPRQLSSSRFESWQIVTGSCGLNDDNGNNNRNRAKQSRPGKCLMMNEKMYFSSRGNGREGWG